MIHRTPVGNYYGTVKVIQGDNGEWYLELRDWCDPPTQMKLRKKTAKALIEDSKLAWSKVPDSPWIDREEEE